MPSMTRPRIPWVCLEGSIQTGEKVKLLVYQDGGLFRFRLTICTRDMLGSLPEVNTDTSTKEILKEVHRWMLDNRGQYMMKEDNEVFLKYLTENGKVLGL